MADLTHMDGDGKPRMVDVSEKPETERRAVARGKILMLPETRRLILARAMAKGDAILLAEMAGLMGAKRTSDLIPLCHPLALTHARVAITPGDTPDSLEIEAECRMKGRTGVEMEALTAVSVAALTLYDMCKAIDRGMRITEIRLIAKEGGKSGVFTAP